MAVLAQAPDELTRAPLKRLGEGIGKVVYASDHWVVKRERSASEVIALIAIWKVLRRIAHFIPAAEHYLEHPSRVIRFLRLVLQTIVQAVPPSSLVSHPRRANEPHLSSPRHAWRSPR